MNTDPAEIARLEDLIKAAFADVPYPTGELIEHDCDECHNLRDNLKGKHWSELPPEIVQSHIYNLALLAPEAWHFYLPAFLIRGLHDEEEEMAQYMAIVFTPPEEDELEEREFHQWFDLPRLEKLTRAQRDAVLQFLDWYEQLQIQHCTDWDGDDDWWQEKMAQGIQPSEFLREDNENTGWIRNILHDLDLARAELRSLNHAADS